MERTLVLLKPDTFERKLVGSILERFDRAGHTIVNMRMFYPAPPKDVVERHLASANFRVMGEKISEECRNVGLDVEDRYGTDDFERVGKIMCERIVEYFTSGPMLAMILEGYGVVQKVRLQLGHTIPAKAAPGTIRGDFSVESAEGAERRRGAAKNLVHASGNSEEAKLEIPVWFP